MTQCFCSSFIFLHEVLTYFFQSLCASNWWFFKIRCHFKDEASCVSSLRILNTTFVLKLSFGYSVDFCSWTDVHHFRGLPGHLHGVAFRCFRTWAVQFILPALLLLWLQLTLPLQCLFCFLPPEKPHRLGPQGVPFFVFSMTTFCF